MAGTDIPRWMWALADDFPFAPPPEGVIPNFEHPKLVHYHSLTIGCSCCIFLLLLVSAARLYSKLRVPRKATIDDYFFWVTLPMLLLVLSLYTYLDNGGAYGYHAWDIKIRTLTKPLLVITFIHQMVLPVTIWLIKATIFFLILNAFKTIKWLQTLCWIGIITTFIFYTVSLAILVANCHPRGGTDRTSFLAGMASHQCAGSTAAVQKLSVAGGVFGVISDLYILIIPLPAVAKLQIKKKKKLGVYLIFSSGLLACIASILSLSFRIHSFGTKDLLVDSIPTMTINMVEVTVGLLITCIAPIAKLVRHKRNKRFQSLGGGNKDRTDNPGGILLPNRRKHAPGGLSELDSMKTFGTTVNTSTSHDSGE